MADNSTQGGTDTIRDKDRAGVKTQIFGVDTNIGGGSEVLQTAAALADATANPTIPAWASMGMVFNGTTWDRMRGDTTNGVDVDVTRMPSLPAGAAIIGKVDINSAPQVAVNNVETLTDNAAFTDGTSKVFMSGGVFDESAGTALTENDAAASRINANRAVVTVTEDGVTRGRYATVKAASTAAAATDPAQVVTLSPNSPAPLPTLTKGTQGATGATTQDLKDAGRNAVHLWCTATSSQNADTLVSLTGYKSGAAVGAATAPAVVTSGKTLRIQSITLGYGAIATAGNVRITLRANTSGVIIVTSPIVNQWSVGAQAPATAGAWGYVEVPIPDGLEFAAGTGIGFTALGVSTAQVGTAVGFFTIALVGYEY